MRYKGHKSCTEQFGAFDEVLGKSCTAEEFDLRAGDQVVSRSVGGRGKATGPRSKSEDEA